MKFNIGRTIFIIISFLFVSVGLSAQNCIDYHKNNCKTNDGEEPSGYSYNAEASRSGLLMKGQTSEFRFDIHQGKDYRLTLCNDPVLGDKVQFKIVDFEDNTMLYDNADFNFSKDFEFTVLMNRNIKIVVTVPADDKTQKTTTIGLKPKPTQMGCVGILVESMVTPKKGF